MRFLLPMQFLLRMHHVHYVWLFMHQLKHGNYMRCPHPSSFNLELLYDASSRSATWASISLYQPPNYKHFHLHSMHWLYQPTSSVSAYMSCQVYNHKMYEIWSVSAWTDLFDFENISQVQSTLHEAPVLGPISELRQVCISQMNQNQYIL